MLAPRSAALVLCAGLCSSCIDLGVRIDPESYQLDLAAWYARSTVDVDGDGVRDLAILACPTDVDGSRALVCAVSSRTLEPVAALESDPFLDEPLVVSTWMRPGQTDAAPSTLMAAVRTATFAGARTGPAVETPRVWRELTEDEASPERWEAWLGSRIAHTRRPGDESWWGPWVDEKYAPGDESRVRLPAWFGTVRWIGDLDGDGRLDHLQMDDERTVSIRSGADDRVLLTVAFEAGRFATAATGFFPLDPTLPRRAGASVDSDAPLHHATPTEEPLAAHVAGDVDHDGVGDLVVGCQLSESTAALGTRTVRLGLVSVVSGADGRVLISRTIQDLARSVRVSTNVVRLPVTPLRDAAVEAFEGEEPRPRLEPSVQQPVRPDPWGW